MGDKKYGNTNNVPDHNGDEEAGTTNSERVERTFRDRVRKWGPGVGGGFASALGTFLFLIIPVINTWLANAKEISLAQVKNSAEQIQYISKRMEDSDKERDLYRTAMNSLNAKVIELQDKLFNCESDLRKK